MANKSVKLKREVKGASKSVPMTDELYDELSKAQQFLAALAEAFDIEVQLGTIDGRHFVHSTTIDELVEQFS